MRQVQLTNIETLELSDSPKPEIIKADDVLLRIEAVGICGSDIHYFRHGNIGCQKIKFPETIGHECSATVIEVGEGVESLKAGDRVAIEPSLSCHNCEQCRLGRFHTCNNNLFMGCPGQLPGCLSEYYVMPEHNCFKIPDHMSLDEAALIEPFTIAIYAVDLSGVEKGDDVAILGAGPIGLSIMIALKAKGIKSIAITEPLTYRRELAMTHGADDSCDPYRVDTPSYFSKRKFDYVFECCGQQSALDDGCLILKKGGKLVLVGIPETKEISFNPDIMRRHELSIQNVRRQNNSVEKAIAIASRDDVDLSFMISHRLPLEDVQHGFNLLANYQDNAVKVMIHP